MKKKITLLLTLMITISLIGCANRQDVDENDNLIGQIPSVDAPRNEEGLNGIEIEDVDENINGFNIEDDIVITKNTEVESESKRSIFSQQLRTQVLSNPGTNNITILENYENTLPDGINNNLQYSYYDLGHNYFLSTSENGAAIRENPNQASMIMDTLSYLDKASLLQRVQGDGINNSNIWYRVLYAKDNEIKSGYIHSSAGIHRSFKFNEMQTAINELLDELDKGELHFISNYKNYNGAPPSKNNATVEEYAVDEYGYRSYHSAPAYVEANTNSDFRYIPDGILVRILDNLEEFYYVEVPTFNSNYYVPKQYINSNNTLNILKNVVVVDRTQQNQASFVIDENGLDLISYTFSTTGVAGQNSYETTLGAYKAIEKKDRFLYLQKGSQEIAGYAPYAIRFTGGAYIHGVPVEFAEEKGEKIDPGKLEYLHTIGSFPRSSMCVRNYTSHAKFLYDWMDIENGAVIVIE
jgi:hypothetical protein